jgi:hypothetical protein
MVSWPLFTVGQFAATLADEVPTVVAATAATTAMIAANSGIRFMRPA